MLSKVKLIAHYVLGLVLIIWLSAYTSKTSSESICNHIEVQFIGKPFAEYLLTPTDVLNNLFDNEFSLVGKKINEIDFDAVEQVLETMPLVKNATVFCDFTGQVIVKIEEPKPILRILPNTGKSYLMDEDGNILPVSRNYSPAVQVITGNLKALLKLDSDDDKNSFKEEIYQYAKFIESNKFWKAQIQQTNVDEKSDLQLVPRVGYHNIELGKIHNFRKKLNKLKIFYTDGLHYTGWYKYSVIDLRFEGQIVCTKK